MSSSALAHSDQLTIATMSDTHELHREVDPLPADLLIFAGDFTMFSRSMAAIRDFNLWLGELPYRNIVLTAGNHESFLVSDLASRKLLSNATVLISEAVEVAGLRIWASPVTPLRSGAFAMLSHIDRGKLYSTIPDDTDIIVTHTPPFGILDASNDEQQPAGCFELLRAVQRVQPILHVFGHIHNGGVARIDGTTYVNASMLNTAGDVLSRPMMFQIQRGCPSARRSDYQKASP